MNNQVFYSISFFVALVAISWATFSPQVGPKSHLQPIINFAQNDSIRLLILEPGTYWAPIRCKLYHTTFVQRPSYKALSYTWGHAEETRSIEVNSVPTGIGNNLWVALRHLRHENQPQTLWVDALCIDQRSVEDKNNQIPIMANIYARAQQVIVWLGQHKTTLDPKCGLASFSSVRDFDISTWDSCAKVGGSLIEELIHEEYLKRTWIIQEIGMGADIVVCFGDSSLSWDKFLLLVEWYRTHNPSTELVHYILKLGRLRESRYKHGETYALSDLLSTFRDSFSSVLHDKVYAFLGLANDHFGEIKVDHEQSLFELYRNLVCFQSTSDVGSTQKHVEMVYFSALIRQVLTRKVGQTSQKVKVSPPDRFMSSHLIWTNWYAMTAAKAIAADEIQKEVSSAICKDNANSTACEKNGDDGGLGILLLYMVLYPVVHTWIAVSDWLSILDMRTKIKYTNFWYPTTNEDIEIWKPRSPANEIGIEDINLRGAIVGEIQHIGPSIEKLLASFEAKKKWTAGLTKLYANITSLKTIRGQNERLMRILETPSGMTTETIQDFPLAEPSFPRVFIGHNLIAGIVPPGSKFGDVICQFWNSSASAVLRLDGNGEYKIVGRAGFVQHGESGDWDITEDMGKFNEEAKWAVDLKVDIETLTSLSLDSVSFPASWPGQGEDIPRINIMGG